MISFLYQARNEASLKKRTEKMKKTTLKTNKNRVIATQKYITNGHWLFKREFFKTFFKTENSKINTAIELGQNFIFDRDQFNDYQDESKIDSIINQHMQSKDLKQLKQSSFYTKEESIFLADDFIVTMNKDYSDSLEASGAGLEFRTSSSPAPAGLYKKDELVGIIMPTRTGSFFYDYKQEIEKIHTILNK